MKRLALIAVSVFVLAGCGALGAAKAHTLSLAYKAGDTYTYKLHASSEQTVTTSEISFPLNFDISADESIKVKSVDSSGTADLAITLSNLTMKSTMGGVSNTTTGVPAQTINVQVGADGRLVSVEGNQLPGGTPMQAFSGLGGGFFITAVLPAKPVKPGDTWTKDYDQANPNGTGGTHVTSKSFYLRDESLNGVNAAVRDGDVRADDEGHRDHRRHDVGRPRRPPRHEDPLDRGGRRDHRSQAPPANAALPSGDGGARLQRSHERQGRGDHGPDPCLSRAPSARRSRKSARSSRSSSSAHGSRKRRPRGGPPRC